MRFVNPCVALTISYILHRTYQTLRVSQVYIMCSWMLIKHYLTTGFNGGSVPKSDKSCSEPLMTCRYALLIIKLKQYCRHAYNSAKHGNSCAEYGHSVTVCLLQLYNYNQMNASHGVQSAVGSTSVRRFGVTMLDSKLGRYLWRHAEAKREVFREWSTAVIWIVYPRIKQHNS